MKKTLLTASLLGCLILAGCGDNKKPESGASQSPVASASLPAEVKPAETPDATVSKGLGITSAEYQSAYNAQVQQFNTQMQKDPVRMAPLNLKISGRQFKSCPMSYACLDGSMTEDGKQIEKISITGTLTLQTPKSLALAPVHIMIGTASAIPGTSIPEVKSLLDQLANTAQKSHSTTASTVYKGYKVQFSHPKEPLLVLTVSKP